MLEIKEEKEDKIFFRGEEVRRYTQNDGQIEWSDIWFTKKGRTIGRTVLSPLDKTQGLVIREEKGIKLFLDMTGIGRRFLMAVPNDATPEIVIYSINLTLSNSDDPQIKKIRRIFGWSLKHKEFDSSFVDQLYSLKEKGHQLTPAQEKALDNIIEKWRIP